MSVAYNIPTVTPPRDDLDSDRDPARDGDPKEPAAARQRSYEAPEPERPATAEDTLPVDGSSVLDYADAPRHDPYAALRFRDYQLYSVGWLFAVLGYHLQGATVGWEIFGWTRSALHLGIAGGVQALPLLLLGLHAGAAVDRFDRRLIASVGAALTGCCSLALLALSASVNGGALSPERAVLPMYAIIFAGGVVATFTRPARAALLPRIVPQHAFPNAVTWNSSIFEVASMAGPAFAGMLIAWLSPRTAYFTAALFAFVFAATLIPIRSATAAAAAADDDDDDPARRGAAAGGGDGGLLAGLRFVLGSKIMLAAITLDLFAVLLGGAVYLLPQFAEEVLRVGPVGFGWLRAAPAIGAFSMAVVLAHRPPMRRAGRNLLLAVAAFGTATVLFGISRSFWLSLLALLLAGASDNISVVIRHTLVQLLTPDSMRGRVSAVNTIFIGSSNELGGLRAGVTSHVLGPTGAVVLGGLGTLAVVAAVAVRWPQVGRLGSLHDLRPEADPHPAR